MVCLKISFREDIRTKVAVSQGFLICFSSIEPIWAPDERSKIFLLKNLFLREIRKKFDSSQAITVRSRKLKCLEIQNWLTLHGD